MAEPLFFITSSNRKFKEALQVFKSDHYYLVQLNYDLQELQGSPDHIVIQKAVSLVTSQQILQYPFFIEDTCLCFNALNGMPGPYIKDFMGSIGLDGLNKLLAAHDDKSAYALCTIGLMMEKGQKLPFLFSGRVDGKIVPERGTNNFGWDPIFEINEKKTFAEMTDEKKNSISHRYLAFKQMNDYLNNI